MIESDNWKTLIENENYEISCEYPHCVRNKKSKRILKPGVDSRGYLRIDLYHLGKRVTYKVHRLIVNNLVSEIPDGMCVDHVNNIRTDNRIENLRIVSCYENSVNINNKGAKFVYFNEEERFDLELINHDGIFFNPINKKFYRHIFEWKFRELKLYYKSKNCIEIKYKVNGKTIAVNVFKYFQQ